MLNGQDEGPSSPGAATGVGALKRDGPVLVLLTALYLLVVGSATPWDVAVGLVLGSTVRALFPPSSTEGARWSRVVGLPRFAWGLVLDILRGSLQVATMTLGLRPADRGGVVEVPLGDRTARGARVTAWVTALSPGTVLVVLDWEKRVMWMQAVDASDPEALRQQVDDFYRRYQRPVFP